MNAPTTINTALIARGLLPMDGYVSCPCCGDNQLHRDDMDTAKHFEQSANDRLTIRFGAPICIGCTDEILHAEWLAEEEGDGEESEHDFQRREAALAGHFS